MLALLPTGVANAGVWVVWVEGQVHTGALPDAPPDPTAPPLRETSAPTPVQLLSVLASDQQLILGAGARLDLMIEGDAFLTTIEGPAEATILAEGSVRVQRSTRFERRRLRGFRLGKSPVWTRWQPGPATAPDALLALIGPMATDIASTRPTLSWRWRGVASARFDLMLERFDPMDGLQPVERWRGLADAQHRLWHPLLPGAYYRWSISAQAAEAMTVGPNPSDATPSVVATAWFRVATAAENEALAQSLDALDSVQALIGGDGADGFRDEAMSVLRARALETHGRLGEAAAVWAALAARSGRLDVSKAAAGLGRRVMSPEHQPSMPNAQDPKEQPPAPEPAPGP